MFNQISPTRKVWGNFPGPSQSARNGSVYNSIEGKHIKHKHIKYNETSVPRRNMYIHTNIHTYIIINIDSTNYYSIKCAGVLRGWEKIEEVLL